MAYSLSRVKGNRSEKWDSAENALLLELIKHKISIIEDKDISSVSCERKNAAWKEVHREFSAVTGSRRDVLRLKEKWKRMKLHARKRISRYYKLQHREQGADGNCDIKFNGADDMEIGEPTDLDWEVKDILTRPFVKTQDAVIVPEPVENVESITPDILQPTLCNGETSVRLIGIPSTPVSITPCPEETNGTNKDEEANEADIPLRITEVTSMSTSQDNSPSLSKFTSKRLQFLAEAYKRRVEPQPSCYEEENKLEQKFNDERRKLQMEIYKQELSYWEERRNNQNELHSLQVKLLKEQLSYWEEKRNSPKDDDDVIIKKELDVDIFQ